MSLKTNSTPHWRLAQRMCDHQALKFGNFRLKSGQESGFFFNFGAFSTGSVLRELGEIYATVLREKFGGCGDDTWDVLFGPAYKGIPLVVSVASALAGIEGDSGGDVSFAYDRKEVKDHGEGGKLSGADIKGKRLIIIDDVLTAGTAAREAKSTVESAGGTVVGLLVGLDRRPINDPNRVSFDAEFDGNVHSILQLDSLIEWMRGQEGLADKAEQLLAESS